MTEINSRTLRGKFFFTVSIGVAALVVLFLLALDAIKDIERDYSRMRDTAVAGRIAALDMAKDINYFSRLTRNIMLGGDFDKDIKQIDGVIASVGKNFDNLAKNDFPPEAKTLIAKAKAAAADFTQNGKALILPLKDVPVEKRPAVYSEYEKKVTPHVMAFREHFGAFEKAMVKLSDEAMANLAAEIEYDRRQLWMAFIVAVALVYGAGYFLTNSDLKAMRDCVAFAGELGGETQAARLDPARCASLSQLAGALNDTADNLARFRAGVAAAQAEAGRERDEAHKALEAARVATERAERAKQEGAAQAAAGLEGVIAVIDQASDRLLSHVDHCRAGAGDQARRAGETAVSMEQMNHSVLDVAKSASQAALTAGQARDKARDGAHVAERVMAGMRDVRASSLELKNDMGTLGRKAESIGAVLNVISDIADQTNLLALNAAIEAARAGDAGRGFAVVADEVRKLAEKTMLATKEVDEAIKGVQDGTRLNVAAVDRAVGAIEDAAGLAGQSGRSLGEIVTLAGQVSDQISSIAAASEEQSAASDEINRSMDEVSAIAERSSGALEEASGVVSELAEQARVLKRLVAEMQA
jgi:methyl-accepting chemotaxis protein